MYLFRRIILLINNPKYVVQSIYFMVQSYLIRLGLLRTKKYTLVIFDDLFPHPISGFRFSEFLYYLKNIPNVQIFCTGHALAAIHEKKKLAKLLEEFKEKFPEHRQQISIFNPHQLINAELAYCIFLDNAYHFYKIFKKNNLPFVFTLYPGGGFYLGNSTVSQRIHSLVNSIYFRSVFVTQQNTFKILSQPPYELGAKVHFIFGAVLPTSVYLSNPIKRKYFKLDKLTLDICFVANKQMAGGLDKGFDIFMEVVNRFAEYKDIMFHVVGPFTELDSKFTVLTNICYKGMLSTQDLKLFFSGMDIILSPNRPFTLRPGAFDGFPTAACTEASLCGVAMFVTDPLNLNSNYLDGEDIVLITESIDETCDRILYYKDNHSRLVELSKKGMSKTTELYSEDVQLKTRLKLLLKEIAK